MLDEIVKLKPQLEQSGLSLLAITQGKSEEVATFCQQYAPGILCLADPQRQAYRLYRLERGGLLQTFLSPRVWVSNAQAKKKGYYVQPPPSGQDAMQNIRFAMSFKFYPPKWHLQRIARCFSFIM